MTRTKKAERTRALILDSALELLNERGYDKATMRAIAEHAGVSVGNAYYYFRSKEELIQAFYARTHEEHLAAALPFLEGETTLKGRLAAVMRAKLDTIEPYHRFAGVLFKSAADPKSPLNPFSAESQPVRAEATALFAEVISGSNARVPKKLAVELPDLLWTWHMAILLFWIHDDSRGRRRTWTLLERSTDLVVKLISISSLRVMAPVRNAALRMVAELRGV